MKNSLIITATLISIVSKAAVVTWQSNPSNSNHSAAIVDEGCVYNGGLDYNAVSFGHTDDVGASYGINGVVFYAAGLNHLAFTATSGITIWQSFPDGAACDTSSERGNFARLSPGFQAILGTDTYREKTKYYQISGLVEGQEYAIQIFVNDSSHNGGNAAKTVVNMGGDFTGQVIEGEPSADAPAICANRSGADGGLGNYLYGTFVAGKGAHQFTVGKGQHVNAINVQAVPEEVMTNAMAFLDTVTVTP